MPDDHQAGDPAQAFEDLRAEVSVLRKAVEALPATIHENRPPDYAQDLAVIGKGLDEIGGQLETIGKSPALRMTPEEQGRSIANAGSTMIFEASKRLEQAAIAADNERYELKQLIGTLGTKEQRRRFWAIILLSIFFLGFIAFPFVTRAMPGGLKRAVAATIMGASQWDAGMALMKAGNPDGWALLVADTRLVTENRSKITACRDTATKTKKEERCPIAVQVP